MQVNAARLGAAVQHGLTSDADAITQGLETRLQSRNYTVLHHPLPVRLDPKVTEQSSHTFEQNGVEADEDSYLNLAIAYIGGESLNLTNLLMTHSRCEVSSQSRDLISIFIL